MIFTMLCSILFHEFFILLFQVTTNPIPATLLPQQPHPPSAVLHQQNLSHAHPTVTKSESNSIIIVKSCQTWTGFSRQFLTIFGKIIDALFWEKTVIILLEFSSCTLGFSRKHNQKNCKNWVSKKSWGCENIAQIGNLTWELLFTLLQ